MNGNRPFAHVKKNPDGSWAEPQSLVDHLRETAQLAETFAASFDSASWGRACGLAHDMGKGTAAWQKYLTRKSGYDEEAQLETKTGTIDHSTPSACFVEDVFGKGVGRVLSYCIAGHPKKCYMNPSVAHCAGQASLSEERAKNVLHRCNLRFFKRSRSMLPNCVVSKCHPSYSDTMYLIEERA